MQLQQVITRNPETVRPDDSIHSATVIMRDNRIGFLPVIDDGKVLGVVTDRDIIIRAIAGGYDPCKTVIRDVMTDNPVLLQTTDSVELAIQTMARYGIARIVVVDLTGKMVGVLSSGDAATACNGDEMAGQLAVAIHRRANRQQPLPWDGAQFVSD